MSYGYQIYFSERTRNRVIAWNPDQGIVKVVADNALCGGLQPGGTFAPCGLAMDAGGHLLVADRGQSRLFRRTNQFTVIATSDTTGQRSQCPAPWRNYPMGPSTISVNADGSLLVCYSEEGVIYRVLADSTLQLVLGAPMNPFTINRGYRDQVASANLTGFPLMGPTSAVTAADGTIYFIERGYNIVRSYHPARGLRSLGNIRASSLTSSQGKPDPTRWTQPANPSSLLIDGHGSLYVSDGVGHCLWQCQVTSGAFQLSLVLDGGQPGIDNPAAYAIGPDGTLWVVNHGRGMIEGYVKQGITWNKVMATCTTMAERPIACLSTHSGAGIAIGA
jgi:sugar lactone lactonase YvrE